MTKKDFFRIIIKLFGLYWLINTIFSLSQIIYFVRGSISDSTGVIFTTIGFLFAIMIYILLIAGADKIIGWLKLESGFDDERIDFQNFSISNIVILAIILIGGSMILDNIGMFFNQIYLSLRVMMSNQSDLITMQGQSTYHLILSMTKIILGYLLLTNYPFVSRYLLRITQKGSEDKIN